MPTQRAAITISGTLVAVLCVVVLSCTPATLSVVATTTIVGGVVAEVGGNDISLTVLLPQGADPHAFEPTPQDLTHIARSDVLFMNGAGLESGMETLLDQARGAVVSLAQRLALRRLGQSPNGEPSNDHQETDPHVWLDPTNVMIWVDTVARALSTQDPVHTARFQERAAAYRRRLSELDLWIWDQVNRLSTNQRQLVTDHAAWGYFASRYGFRQVGFVLPGFSTLADPSARELAKLEDSVRDRGVPAIFVSITAHPVLTEQVARDTGTHVVPLYTGSLSRDDGPAANYVDLMKYNVTEVVGALLQTREQAP